MKKSILCTAAMCALIAGAGMVFAQRSDRVTVVHGASRVDGASQVTETLLEECIVSLPSLNEIEADVTASTSFLREINGEAGRNDHVKTYTARAQVSYRVRQKILIIITQNSLDGQEPVTREEERVIMRTSNVFESDSGEGDIFAGRSNRRYFYSTPEAAANSAKKRAQVWITQQQNVLCSAGGGR